ncbi:hypothetical protein SS1_32 [Cronobacter phage vB_CsaP_Ss1]|nr:hypothetical protein SS1_32 [Cronobacter phage vB_CsaP_Ss1]
MAKRIIAVDLDGTLAYYDGWKGIEHIGSVIPEVANAIERAQKEGADVWIFTARVSDPSDAEQAGKYVHDWLIKNNIKFEGITAVKHKFFSEFWDDRAIQVIKNTGEFVMYSDGAHMSGLPGHDHMAIAAETWYDHKTRVKSVLHSMKNEPAFTPVNSALDIQEGGDHYKKYKIQPIEFVVANNIPVLEANAQKYILRHADKNGMGDLRKARHYLELMAEMYYGEKL